jgi:hypothetical protein
MADFTKINLRPDIYPCYLLPSLQYARLRLSTAYPFHYHFAFPGLFPGIPLLVKLVLSSTLLGHGLGATAPSGSGVDVIDYLVFLVAVDTTA